MTTFHFEDAIDFLDRWQTLISGALAILAALIGGKFIVHQTRAQERVEERRTARIRDATRAALPIVLGGVIDWCESVAKCVIVISRLSASPSSVLNPATSRAEMPQFPTGEVVQLKEAVSIAHPEAAKRCVALLHKIQVTDARIRSGADGANRVSNLVVTSDNVSGYAFDLSEVYSLAESLYAYGRSEERDALRTPPPVDEVLKAAHVLGLDDLLPNDAHDRLERRRR